MSPRKAKAQTLVERAAKAKEIVLEAPPREVRKAPHPTIPISWTITETKQHESAIESMLLYGTMSSSIVRTMRAQYGVGPKRVGRLIARIRDRWVAEDAEARSTNKAAAVRRLTQQIRKLTVGERDPGGGWVVKPDPKTAARYEQLLSEIQGTKAPLEVNVMAGVAVAAMSAIAELTPEELQQELRELEEEEEQAARYRLGQGIAVQERH